MVQYNHIFASALALAITGCGGGGGGGSLDDTPSTTDDVAVVIDPVVVDSVMSDSAVVEPIVTIEGLGIVPGIEIEEIELETINGVEFSITGFSILTFRDIEKPIIEFAIRNNSLITPIHKAKCEITALRENNARLDVGTALFAGGSLIDPGESTAETAVLINIDDGFDSIDSFLVECELIEGDNTADVINGSVQVEFVEFGFSEPTIADLEGSVSVMLLLTNNSPNPISDIDCRVEAKRDEFIADTARLTFGNYNDGNYEVQSGEADERTGLFEDIVSLDEFDSDTFDLDNINCTFTIE